jgi:hypothetical protein
MARFCPRCGTAAVGHNYCSECRYDLRNIGLAGTDGGTITAPTASVPASPGPALVDDRVSYRPSVPWTVVAVLWWLFNAFPLAVTIRYHQHQADIVVSLAAVLAFSGVGAALLRSLWVLVGHRWRWREASAG